MLPKDVQVRIFELQKRRNEDIIEAVKKLKGGGAGEKLIPTNCAVIGLRLVVSVSKANDVTPERRFSRASINSVVLTMW